MSDYISDLFIDPTSLPDNAWGFIQVITLGLFYFVLLVIGSVLIVEGTELLLLVPSWAPFVGSFVLPIVSAIPEGSLVFFSGDTQSDLYVGIGTLSGSVVATLTIPWFFAILFGRVDIIDDKPNYKTTPHLTYEGYDLTMTGIGIPSAMNIGAILMFISLIPYILIQISGLIYYQNSAALESHEERPWSLSSALIALFIGTGYLVYQYYVSNLKLLEGNFETKIARRLEYAIRSRQVTLLGIFINEIFGELLYQRNSESSNQPTSELDSLLSDQQPEQTRLQYLASGKIPLHLKEKFKLIILPFFNQYDLQRTGEIYYSDITSLLRDLGEDFSASDIQELFGNSISNQLGANDSFRWSDMIEFDTFVDKLLTHIQRKAYEFEYIQESRQLLQVEQQLQRVDEITSSVRRVESDVSALAEDKHEIPEDLKNLSPDDQQFYIRWRAAWMITLGVLIVVIISDPMVDILSDLGVRTGISSYYVAFVLGPLASMAPEAFAAYNYSIQKTLPSIDVALSTLQGSVIMNNTYVLSIFLFIIYFQTLRWAFFAETLCVIVVVLILIFFSSKRTNTLLDGVIILSCYPLAIALVVLVQYSGYE